MTPVGVNIFNINGVFRAPPTFDANNKLTNFVALRVVITPNKTCFNYGINTSSQNSAPHPEGAEILRTQTAKTHGILVSVSAVRVSSDLSVARAYLSIFPSEKGAEILANINNSAKTIRYELGQKVRYQLRKIPELTFHIDDSLDYIENIDNLLKQ